MLLALQVLVQHVLIAALFLFWMTGGRYARALKIRSRPEALLFYAAMAGFFAFLLLCGAWHIVGYWLRPIVFVLFVLASFDFFARLKNAPDKALRGLRGWGNVLLYSAMAVFFGAQSVLAVTGRLAPQEHVDLAFPLSEGVYVVGQGGAATAVNYHHAYPPQAYALDILKINPLGLRARGLMPEDPEKYEIYGDAVSSPCDGRVVWVRDGLADSRGPQREREAPAGNAVAIECDGAAILMAHFAENSILVEEGQTVTAGETLGRVGNSGNTTEPHLHIHASSAPFDGEGTEKPGLAIRFEGRWLARGDLVFAGGRR